MDIYEALSRAETMGEPNPWIRTRVRPVGGSSAFGPVQITKNLIEDAINRKILSDQSAQFANQVMLPMQEKFLTYGGVKNLPTNLKTYDYGGTGGFDPNMYGEQYKAMANELIQYLYNQSGKDMNKFIKRWRGKDPEKEYINRFYGE